MKERFEAGPNASLVVDESIRQRWESVGVVGEHAQDEVFQAMARAVEVLTSDETDQPTSHPTSQENENPPTNS